jgi:hypothetical protein
MKLFSRKPATLLLGFMIFAAGFFALASPATAGRAIDTAPMASDGVRYFAYLTPKRVPAVLDTWRQETNLISNARGCQPLDVGGSRVLLTCGRADSDSMRITKTASARGGKAVRVPNGKSGFWYSIGRYWLEGNPPCTGTGGCLGGRAYLNWRTGKRGNPQGIPGDFDRANLNRKRIAYQAPPFVPASHVKGFQVCWAGNVFVTDDGKIRVWSSRRNSMVIGRGGVLESACDPYQGLSVGSGRVTWNRGRVIHAYNTRSGMSYKRKLKKPTKIVPVRDGAVIAMKTRDARHDRYRVRFIPLP